MVLSTLNNFFNSDNGIANTIGSAVTAAGSTVTSFASYASDPVTFSSLNRLGNISPTAQNQNVPPTFTTASWGSATESVGNDWRVRIELPPLTEFQNSPVLKPLQISNNSMIFPVTPQIMVNHSAQYNSLQPVHSNYPYHVYQHSQVEDIAITCEFPVENEADGQYWIAAVHFLRSVTKMFYGTSKNRGAPPPLVHLHGYGDFVFNRIPCVVKRFTMDLREGVDYIQVPVTGGSESNNGFRQSSASGGYTYVPTLSMLTVELGLTYSRDQTRNFNLQNFVSGSYIGQGKGFI
jgi:hypothetical protein